LMGGGSWSEFLSGLVIASILPVTGAFLITPESLPEILARLGLRPVSSQVVPNRQPTAPGYIAPSDFDQQVAHPVNSGGGALITGYPPETGKRFLAYFLDAFLAVVTLGVGWMIWSMVLWAKGTSPGKQMAGLVVVDVRTSAPATWGQMFLREIVGKSIFGLFSFGITSIVSVFMILINSDRRGVWDMIANTAVTRSVMQPPSGAPFGVG